jgi:hypothetical protein
MHNDAHKVTAVTNGGVEKLKLSFVWNASALSAVHNMAESISQVILLKRRTKTHKDTDNFNTYKVR